VVLGLLCLALAGVCSSSAQETQTPARLQAAIERLEVQLVEFEALELSWRERDKAESAKASARFEEVAVLEAEFEASERRSPEVDQIYAVANPLVSWSLGELEAALDRAESPSELPAWVRGQVSPSAAVEAFGGTGEREGDSESIDRLEELVAILHETGTRLRELELELRRADVERDTELASRIYRVRLGALHALSVKRRFSVFSLAQEAPVAIALEREVLETVVRLQWFRLRGSALATSFKLRGFLAPLLAGQVLLRLLIIGVLWRWMQRERPKVLAAMRDRALALESPERRRWATYLVGFLEALAPWGIFIAVVAAIGWVLPSAIEEAPLVGPLLMVAMLYGVYRLSVDLAVGAVVASMKSLRLQETPELRQRILSAARWVVRTAVLVAFVLWLYKSRLGAGVLFYKVRMGGLLLLVAVLLLMVLRFRSEIREMFLALKAHGRLADLVRGSADRWSSWLVTPLAFVWLCGRGVLGLVRGVSFGFEQTRTATAYLSRRRMLKIAEQRGYAEGALEDLPSGVAEALQEKLSFEDLERVSSLSELELALSSAESWRQGGAGGSLLLAGEEGLGKAPWVQKFLASQEASTRLGLESRILSAGKLRAWIARGLLPDAESSMSQDQLIEAICAGPKRVVTLEGAENLFLATVNGYRALAELGPIIDGTRKQVFWVLTMSGLAWNHLRAAGKELAFLRRKFVLEPATEKQIKALIEGRLKEHGLEVGYADLMAVEGRREDLLARSRLGRQTFMNYLWDFSDGNSQIALHFFARSLVSGSGGSLNARPFKAPDEEPLAEMGDGALFLLAAVMRHNGLDVRQAAITTAYPLGRVEGLFLHLEDLGAVSRHEEVYRVPVNWRATVLRALRRRNILVA
jgi:hypothetical protein